MTPKCDRGISKKNKYVLLLSSLDQDDKIDQNSSKPEVILDYNSTKGEYILWMNYAPLMNVQEIHDEGRWLSFLPCCRHKLNDSLSL